MGFEEDEEVVVVEVVEVALAFDLRLLAPPCLSFCCSCCRRTYSASFWLVILKTGSPVRSG